MAPLFLKVRGDGKIGRRRGGKALDPSSHYWDARNREGDFGFGVPQRPTPLKTIFPMLQVAVSAASVGWVLPAAASGHGAQEIIECRLDCPGRAIRTFSNEQRAAIANVLDVLTGQQSAGPAMHVRPGFTSQRSAASQMPEPNMKLYPRFALGDAQVLTAYFAPSVGA